MADSKLKLPAKFFFGAAMSGPQTEGEWASGGKLENLWDTWSNEDLGAFYNKVGSYGGNDFMHQYKSDFAMLKELGLDSARTSIQWSRLLDVNGELNPVGATWYHKLIAAAKEAGIELFINLYHFDIPTFLFKRGGWESREVVEAYAHYAKVAFKEFGQEVKYWFTFNEPIVEPEQRYENGVWYPKYKSFNKARATQYNISIAHALGVRAFNEAKSAGYLRDDAQIGIISNFTPVYTTENPTDADLEALRVTEGICNRWWLDLATKGELPKDILDTLEKDGCDLPARKEDAFILQDGVVDWLGCNYYQPKRVQAPTHLKDENGNPIYAENYVWQDARWNKSRGWEIYPEGLYDFGINARDNYPNLKWFVSENGIGIQDEYLKKNEDGIIQDPYRVEFVQDHLRAVARAINEGANCVGYHYWAVIDNWSWANAFKNRYGFIEVDLERGYKRRFKQSAKWLAQVTATHEV